MGSFRPGDHHLPTLSAFSSFRWNLKPDARDRLLKERQPKTLIVWGRNNPLILPAAAEFVKQVGRAADLRYLDASHFALDENPDTIAEAIIETFSRQPESPSQPLPLNNRSKFPKEARDPYSFFRNVPSS